MTEIGREFVGLASPIVGRAGAGGHPCQGIWHTPKGVKPKVGFIATHYNVDFSEHYIASYLAERGFGYLGWNTRFRGMERAFLLDHAVAEIGVGVRWMKEVAGVEKVVVVGNSGGGSLMGAYQSQAVEPNITPTHDLAPLDCIDDLIAGDLYIFLAAHPGRPEIFANWLDASVIDESDPTATDPELDIYNPDHGPPFRPELVARVRAAQVARSNRISQWCKEELVRLNEAGIRDRLFVTNRVWADPRFVDPTLDPNNRPPNSCYFGDPKKANAGVFGVGLVNSLRTWLSMWSLTDSQAQAGPHGARITVPTLLIEADGDSGVFPSDADKILDAVAATDKTRVTLSGDHYFRDPSDARDRVADTIADWAASKI
ncbi:MAG: alpha/beta hydrolase [Actinomycetia bacterium]|nr:alpha/beta hydrolase [Actinomycetes bacterium]MCP3910296.1 alpha/beta hydrolase [Actinomycetes bacterium]MCP4087001.1 alpha/beta hydrolase [Actinomycetes bacterium]